MLNIIYKEENRMIIAFSAGIIVGFVGAWALKH